MGFKISGETSVAEDSAFRVGSFSINGKTLKVPLQALDLKKAYEGRDFLKNIKIDACEIFKTYSKQRLKNLREDSARELSEQRELIKLKVEADKKESTTFLFIRFEGREYPNEDEMKALINISYPYSDATPIPSFPDVFKESRTRTKRNGQKVTEDKIFITDDKLKEYFSFLSGYIEMLNELNHKDILGVIPVNLGTQNIVKIILFYYENGINHFYFDLNTAGFNNLINGSLMHGILRELKRVGLEYQKTFFYSINGSSGRFPKGISVIGNKDILTGGAGLDCTGRLHLGKGGPRKVLDTRVERMSRFNKIKLFNKNDYGYYRLESEKLPFKLPDDFSMDKGLLTNPDIGKKYSNFFNMHQLTIESQNLRDYIGENYKPLQKIEKEKSNVSKLDIKIIKKFRVDNRSLI